MGDTEVNFTAKKEDYSDTDMYNKDYNPDGESEVIHIAEEIHPAQYKTRPFDWFICSVLGYLLCPCTGICAIYYAVRANHAVDWARDDTSVRSHTSRAKYLTIISIVIGIAMMITCIVIVSIMINRLIQLQIAMIEMASLGQQYGQQQHAG